MVCLQLSRHLYEGLWQRTTGALSSVGKHIIHLALPLVHERLKDKQWDGEKRGEKERKVIHHSVVTGDNV